MSFVGDMLGLGGGGSGANYRPQKADLINAVDAGQANNNYNQAQLGLAQQQAFLGALQGQNGIGNQSNILNQQQALANQYQNIADGNGPNPALQQLQNTTGQNVANQAALMASQRGVGANAGLLARQAAQQGAGIQQQAAGQGAVLRAQQQLAGLQGLQQQQGMMGNMANQQVAQLAGATTGYNQAAQSEQQNILNAVSNLNNARVQTQNNVNNIDADIAKRAQQAQGAMFGGLLNGIMPGFSMATGLNGGNLGSLGGEAPIGNIDTGGAGVVDAGGGGSSVSGGGAIDGSMYARGGMVKHYDLGGPVQMGDVQINGPQSAAGRFLFSSSPSQNSADQESADLFSVTAPQAAAPEGKPGGGGPDLGAVSGMVGGLMAALKSGGPVPGKASVKGDSLKNDTVPAMLSPGEVVIPRHVMQSDDPIGNAAKFVQAVMAKKGLGGMRK